ncbi:MAG: PA0069 family radical SAM protein [Cellvibrionaceae bacterium]|nr:PA0069 family radical SAM protein [Cellvibrionaceae bacterium]
MSEPVDDNPEPWVEPPLQSIKGRGALTNIPGRFEEQIIARADDGWWQEADEPGAPRTYITPETARTILTRNQSPDLPFSVSLNPYRGCEHGCVYCFARPTHSYLGLSPGLDFETRIYAKTNAPELLRRELAQPNYQVDSIALGVNTDAYQPCERQLQLTRRVLDVLHECRHPVGLITKSSLIERDMDLLQEMAQLRLAAVAITLTTLDHKLARILEPRAASPTRRLQTIRRLHDAGIPVTVSVAPVIPHITEPELEAVVTAAIDAGASSATYTVLRLPWEVNPLFQQWLETHFPLRAEKVMNCIRDMRGGRENDPNFGSRMRGEGIYADLIRQRFKKALRKLILPDGGRFAGLDHSLFRRPLQVPESIKAKNSSQLDLFSF